MADPDKKAVEIGSPPQMVRLPIDTTAHGSWVFPPCPWNGTGIDADDSCSLPGLYNPYRSETVTEYPATQLVHQGVDELWVKRYSDTVNIGGKQKIARARRLC